MRVEERITIEAPSEAVWEKVADPRLYPRYVEGITRFEPEDEEAEAGAGSRYRMLMKVGSAEIGGLIEIVEYDEGRDLAWTSITGIDQRFRWRMRDIGGGRTRVTMRLSYGAPGGLLGTIADRLGAPEVQRHLRHALQNLKAEVEGGPGVSEEQRGLPGRLMHEVGSVKILIDAGVVRPMRPDKVARVAATLLRWGRGPAAGFISNAVTSPDGTALIDELGRCTFAEVDRRTNQLAHGLSDEGIKEGDAVGVMCRNHRGFVDATVALGKLGAHSLYLNTAFAGPQLAEVVKREKPLAIIYDEEFAGLLKEAGKRRKRYVAWHDSDKPPDPTLSSLAEGRTTDRPVPPDETGRAIILTSGTTGTPKGASRSSPTSLDPAVSLLSKIPLYHGQVTHVAAPLFHTWGFANFSLAMLVGSTQSYARKFDPENCLKLIERDRAEVLVVVPVMLSRILELPEETRRKYDTSSLKVVAASGSALPGDLATKWMDEFGDNLYNLYGSTEVAWATIATPKDMREAPGTAGKAPRATVVKLLDDNGVEVPRGETGRIFVGNEMLFEGYTGGGSKDMIHGLMATGDVGRMDDAGRLFIEGRDDEMIVSGGENVFPKEVEDLLARHDSVAEAAALGVEDEKFGQRLKAFVVPAGGKEPSEDDLKQYVKQNLAGYKVPREFVFLDELPRNATGKVLKRELKEMETAES